MVQGWRRSRHRRDASIGSRLNSTRGEPELEAHASSRANITSKATKPHLGFDFGLCNLPRPCRGPGAVVTTKTTARTRHTDERTSGVIVYLAQNRHSSYGRNSLRLLRRSVMGLMTHYNGKQRDDMLFLHTGDLNRTVQHEILSLCNNVHARMQLLDPHDFQVPPQTPPQSKWKQAGTFTAGYRHMIRLFTSGIWGLVAREGYRFVMRMDEDSFLRSSVPYNFFSRMDAENLDYAYRLASWESGSFAGRFFSFIRNYLQEHQLTPRTLLEPCKVRTVEAYSFKQCGPLYGFYNNFFVSRIDFWLREDVQMFLQQIVHSHYIYTQRWNDILWQSVIVQTLVPPERVAMWDDFAYEHATFSTVQVPARLRETFSKATSTSSVRNHTDAKCLWYGGLALGTKPSLEAQSRLREMMQMPWCRERNKGKQNVRPCLVLRGPPPRAVAGVMSTNSTPSLTSEKAFLAGSVTRQRGVCGVEPEPYHCTTGNRSDHTAIDSDCACSTNIHQMRTSLYAKCFLQLREKEA